MFGMLIMVYIDLLSETISDFFSYYALALMFAP